MYTVPLIEVMIETGTADLKSHILIRNKLSTSVVHIFLPIVIPESNYQAQQVTGSGRNNMRKVNTMWETQGKVCVSVCLWNSRGIFPPLQTLAVKAVIAESGEDAVNRLVHSLQAHSALWHLGELHHRQTGSLKGGRVREGERGKGGGGGGGIWENVKHMLGGVKSLNGFQSWANLDKKNRGDISGFHLIPNTWNSKEKNSKEHVGLDLTLID